MKGRIKNDGADGDGLSDFAGQIGSAGQGQHCAVDSGNAVISKPLGGVGGVAAHNNRHPGTKCTPVATVGASQGAPPGIEGHASINGAGAQVRDVGALRRGHGHPFVVSKLMPVQLDQSRCHGTSDIALHRQGYILCNNIGRFDGYLGIGHRFEQTATDEAEQFILGPDLDTTGQVGFFCIAENIGKVTGITGREGLAPLAEVSGELLIQRVVLSGTLILKGGDSRIIIAEGIAIIGLFGGTQRDLEAGIVNGRGRLLVAISPIAPVFLLFDGAVGIEGIVDLFLGSGAVGQLQIAPNPLFEFIVSTLIPNLHGIGVQQITVDDIDPDIAGGANLIEPEITGLLSKINIACRRGGNTGLISGRFSTGRQHTGIDEQWRGTAAGAVADTPLLSKQRNRAAGNQSGMPGRSSSPGHIDSTLRGQGDITTGKS